MDSERISMSENLFKYAKKVKLNKKEVKFHISGNSIVFDEPISVANGESIEIETVLNEDGTQVVRGVFFCS